MAWASRVFEKVVVLKHFNGHDKWFARTDWLCRCKAAREEERHLTAGACPVYGDLAEGCDVESDEGLKDFFLAVLARRDALDEADREEERG